MRRSVVLSLGLFLAGAATPAGAMIGAPSPAPRTDAPAITKVGYWCSPGFTASYGQCVATASTDEVNLYLNDARGYDEAPPPVRVVRRHHRRHGLAARY